MAFISKPSKEKEASLSPAALIEELSPASPIKLISGRAVAVFSCAKDAADGSTNNIKAIKIYLIFIHGLLCSFFGKNLTVFAVRPEEEPGTLL
jgi:hypothetical protein